MSLFVMAVFFSFTKSDPQTGIYLFFLIHRLRNSILQEDNFWNYFSNNEFSRS